MKILLDIDGVLKNKSDGAAQVGRLKSLGNTVILWSDEPDIEEWGAELDCTWIKKIWPYYPKADALIDDFYEKFDHLCDVKMYFRSVQEFIDKVYGKQ